VAGSAEATQTQTFTITGGTSGTPVSVSAALTVGSNGNATEGSSIDLDIPEVYSMSEAANHVSDLDLCYSYSGVASADKIFTPSHAKASDYTYASGWSNPPTTSFIKTSLTPAEFDDISTAEEIEALWTGTPTETSEVCEEDDVFIVKTTEDVYVLVLISEQTPGKTGTITIKVAK
jgi:hypothetical protein